jgi:hypothetical protein
MCIHFFESDYIQIVLADWPSELFGIFGKAELLQEGIFFFIHIFARDVLVIKRMEIEKTKPIFIISVLKVEY